MSQTTRWGKRGRHDDPDAAREQILKATYITLVTKGLEKTTISEIAKQARVSRPTIYRYFDSRDAIIESLMIKRRDEFFENMRVATLPFRDDFPRLVEECLCFALHQVTRNEQPFDLVSGPNAGKIVHYMNIGGMMSTWNAILEEPYRRYRERTGNVVDLKRLANFMGNMILLIRAYPMSRESLLGQLRAVMSLGKTLER